MTPKKEGKSADHDHNLTSFEGAQDTPSCKISDHSLHAFSGKCPETSLDGQTDGRTDGWTCDKTVMVGRMDQRTHLQVKRGYFRLRTDGQTDGWTDGRMNRQPGNMMPPAPKGRGIKTHNFQCLKHMNFSLLLLMNISFFYVPACFNTIVLHWSTASMDGHQFDIDPIS